MPAPPYSVGKIIPSSPSLPSSLTIVEWELTGLVPLHDIGSDLALGELAHHLLQLQLFLRELESPNNPPVDQTTRWPPVAAMREGETGDLCHNDNDARLRQRADRC